MGQGAHCPLSGDGFFEPVLCRYHTYALGVSVLPDRLRFNACQGSHIRRGLAGHSVALRANLFINVPYIHRNQHYFSVVPLHFAVSLSGALRFFRGTCLRLGGRVVLEWECGALEDPVFSVLGRWICLFADRGLEDPIFYESVEICV